MDNKIPLEPWDHAYITEGLKERGYVFNKVGIMYGPMEIEIGRFYFSGHDDPKKDAPAAFIGREYFEFVNQDERLGDIGAYRDSHIRMMAQIYHILKESMVSRLEKQKGKG